MTIHDITHASGKSRDSDEVPYVATTKLRDDVVEKYVEDLKAAGIDKAAFDAVVTRITADNSLRPAELVAVANDYAVGGTKSTSRTSALARINKRFVELVRTEGNLRIARTARPW